MKKSLLFALTFATFGANAQQKLIASNTLDYDVTGAIQYIDSNEFVYNSWDGSLFSHELEFVFDAVFGWGEVMPAIKWDVQNKYVGNSTPLSLVVTWNNTLVAGNVTISESGSSREEFIYDGAGNVINEKQYNFNGTTFDLIWETTFEFDVNNNLLVEKYIYYGSPVVERIDSLFYDGSNNLIRAIKYNWDIGTSAFYANSESLITYLGSEITNIELYSGTPLDWIFDIDYVYSAGVPESLLLHQVVGGVPETTASIEINYTYGTNSKISCIQHFVDGDLDLQYDYMYDGNGFLSEIIRSELDFNTLMIYESGSTKYYYQSTVGLEDLEIAEATIFPNPSSDFISISTDSEIEQVAIFGVNGAIMLIQNSGDLDISNLPEGVYNAKVKTSTGMAQARFVKQ